MLFQQRNTRKRQQCDFYADNTHFKHDNYEITAM